MPKIPQYNEGQVGEGRLSNVKFTETTAIESFGGGKANVFQGAQELAGEADKIYQKEVEKADQMAVQNAENQLTQIENDLLYNEKTGALNTKGSNSFEVGTKTMEEFKKQSKDVFGALTTPRQKAVFEAKAAERAGYIDRRLQGHISTERTRYDDQITSASIRNEQDAAVKAYQDPARIELAIANQSKSLTEFATRNGIPKEEMDQKISDVVSGTHAGVIQRLLDDDNDIGAEAYFKKYEKQITSAEKVTAINKELEMGSTRGKSQRFVDDVLKKGMSESAAIEQARKIESPKLRDATMTRVQNEYNIRDNAQRASMEKVHISALNQIDGGNINDLTKIRGWTAMTENQRASLQSYAKNKAEGKSTVTDIKTYYNLRDMATNPQTQDKFLKMNLFDNINQLSGEDFKDIHKMQEDLRKNDKAGLDKVKTFRSDDETVMDQYRKAGGPDNKQAQDNFRALVAAQQQAIQDGGGKPMTQSELSALASEQAKKRVIEGGGWFGMDKEVNTFEADQDQLNKSVKYGDIPKGKIAALQERLRKDGKPTSQENIRLLYVKSLLRGR